MSPEKEQLHALDIFAQKNILDIEREINRVKSLIPSEHQDSNFSSEEIKTKIKNIVSDQSLPKPSALNKSIALLRLLRINNLEEIKASYAKPVKALNLSDEENLKKTLENLSAVPPFVFFESLIKNTSEAKKVLDETKPAINTDARATNNIENAISLSDNLLDNYLDNIKSFLNQPKTSTKELSQPQFDNCSDAIKNDIGRFKNEINGSILRKKEDLQKQNGIISSAESKLKYYQDDLKKTEDKDKKPLWKKIARLVTFGKFPKAIDTSQIKKEIDKAATELDQAKKDLEGIKSRHNQIEERDKIIVSSLENALSATDNLKKQFLSQDNSVDKCAVDAADFLTKLRSDSEIKSKLELEEKTAATTARKEDSLDESIASKIAEKLKFAQNIVAGEIQSADKFSTRVLNRISFGLQFAEALPGVGIAAMAIDAVSALNDRRIDEQYKTLAKFAENANGKKIIEALGQELSKRFSQLPIAEQSLDNFSDSLIKKVVKAIISKTDKLSADDSVDEGVEKITKYLQKEHFTLHKKTIEVDKEHARDGATYAAKGFVSKQAIKVTDANGEEVILIPKSRQETDEKFGDSKYGTREATAAEQEKFNERGKLTDYVEFIPTIDRLADSLLQNLNKAQSQFKGGITQNGVMQQISVIAKNCKGLEGKDLDAKLKESLSSIIEPGKRSGPLNAPDKDRTNFNGVKKILIQMIKLEQIQSSKNNIADVISPMANLSSPASLATPAPLPQDDSQNSITQNNTKVVAAPDAETQEIINVLKSEKIELVNTDPNKSQEENIIEAAKNIKKEIESIAKKVHDKEIKEPNLDSAIKESLEKSIKKGTRANFTNKADATREKFNKVKVVVNAAVSKAIKTEQKKSFVDKAKNSTAKDAGKASRKVSGKTSGEGR